MAPSGLRIIRATRKPFYVDAVRVTAENIEAVSVWCGGKLLVSTLGEGSKQYVKVPVEAARHERQTKAYIGDWVLKAYDAFKVYTNKAWLSGFDESSDFACGSSEHTLDGGRCVLSHRHVFTAIPIGCRSFNDYVELEKFIANVPKS